MNDIYGSRREINFSSSEIKLLVSLVLKNKHILENKRSAVFQKKDAWKNLTDEYNANSPQPRSTQTIRQKYNNIKKLIRKGNALRFKKLLKEHKTSGGVIDQLCDAMAVNSRMTDEDEIETPFYVDCDLPVKTEDALQTSYSPECKEYTVFNDEPSEAIPLSDDTLNDIDCFEPIMSPEHPTKRLDPNLKENSKYEKPKVYSEKKSVDALKRQLLEEQINKIKVENEIAATEHRLRVEYAAREHRLRVEHSTTEHILNVRYLQMKITELKGRRFNQRKSRD